MQTIDAEQLKKQWVEEFHLGGLTEEAQEEMISKMIEALLKRIHVGTYERLGETNVDAYEKMLGDKVSEEDLAKWLLEKIPDYEAFARGIAEKFNSEMKETLGIA
jgi:predicted lipase